MSGSFIIQDEGHQDKVMGRKCGKQGFMKENKSD